MTGRPVSPARVDAPSGVRSAYALLLERSNPSRTVVAAESARRAAALILSSPEAQLA